MMHQRFNKLPKSIEGGDENDSGGNRYRNEVRDEKPVAEKILQVNDAKLGALMYFPLIAIVLTSCLGDMYARNANMHREINTARELLAQCPVQDPDSVWLFLVCNYLMMILSIGVLCLSMMGFRFGLARKGFFGRFSIGFDTDIYRPSQRSARIQVITCRICLILIYCGVYYYDVCVGEMPYLKKKISQIYVTCIILFLSAPTLSMPVILKTSRYFPSEPPRWPLFLIKMMVFISYADAGWFKAIRKFSGQTMRAAIADHYIIFEHRLSLLFVDNPWLCSVIAFKTLLFECGAWLLVYLDYDRVAAAIAFSFHLGIYLTMNINYLLFWGCSFVFFFVRSIITSTWFQRFAKNLITKKSVSVGAPYGCSFDVGSDKNKKDGPCTGDGRNVTKNEGYSSNLKRHRKLSIVWAVSCAVVLTYKSLAPDSMMLPFMGKKDKKNFFNRVYKEIRQMSVRPFHHYKMYSAYPFPVTRTVVFLNLKQNNTNGEPVNTRRVKWIPNRTSEEYFFLTMLENLSWDKDQKHKFYLLDNDGNFYKQKVTMCNYRACLAHRFIFETNDGRQGWRREIAVDESWNADSLELVDISLEPQEVPEEKVNDEHNNNVPKILGTSSLHEAILPLCALDIGSEYNDNEGENDDDHSEESSNGGIPRYKGSFCDSIFVGLDVQVKTDKVRADLAELNKAATKKTKRSLNTNEEPKAKPEPKPQPVKDSDEPGMGTLSVAMILMGYKTYLLASR